MTSNPIDRINENENGNYNSERVSVCGGEQVSKEHRIIFNEWHCSSYDDFPASPVTCSELRLSR